MTRKENRGIDPADIVKVPAAEHPPAASRPDDELRRLAAERLAEHLDIGASLVARCEELAFAPKGDRLGPLYAAARLMRANAHLAEALAHVAQVERRQRSIVERIQPPDPKLAEWNSKIKSEGEAESAKEKLIRRLDALMEHSNSKSGANNHVAGRIEDAKEDDG